MAAQACLLLCLPYEHLSECLPCPSTAPWWRGLTCSYPCLSQHRHIAAHACLVCLPATSQGYYTEAQACLYAHLIAIHLTMRQSRLTCLHVGCVGFHHVASCEHPFCMPTICQYCYVMAQACPVYTPAVFQHYCVITQAFLFTCLSHTRATTYCPGFSYLRE